MTSTLTPDASHIVAVWDAATDAQRSNGLAWYTEAYNTAQAFAQAYNVTLAQAAGVLAATSPNNSWRANVALAERILKTRDTSAGYFRTGLDKAQRILNGEDPAHVFESRTYFKVANFYRAILSKGRDGVCVDRHAWDVATGQRHTELKGTDLPVRPNVAGSRYRLAQDAYEQAAQILTEREGREISGCEVQAVTWIAWRRRFWNEGAFDTERATTAPADVLTEREFVAMLLDYVIHAQVREEVAA